MLIPISVYLSTTISSKDHPKHIWFQLIKNRIFKILHNQKQLWPLAPVLPSFGTKGPTLGQKFVKIISAKLDFNSFSDSWKILKNTTLPEQFKNHIHRGIIDNPVTNIHDCSLSWLEDWNMKCSQMDKGWTPLAHMTLQVWGEKQGKIIKCI